MKGRGFTLTEVMVVITIVAIVAAIIYPVIVNVKKGAEETKCTSNLHQISLAVFQYQHDFGGDGVFGDANAMGLPPSPDVLTGYEQLAKDLWKCRGAGMAGMPYSLYCYMAADDPDTKGTWTGYASAQQSQAVLFADFNHRNEGEPWGAAYLNKFALGLHLDGHVSRKVGHGMMCSFDFWIQP